MSNATFVPTPSKAALAIAPLTHASHVHRQSLNLSTVSHTHRLHQQSDVSNALPLTPVVPRSCTILWFRVGDLRISDNAAVACAATNANLLLPIATVSRSQLNAACIGALSELQFKLVSLGSLLVVQIVGESIAHHVDAVCNIVDFIRPKYLVHNENARSDRFFFAPLQRRSIYISTFSSSSLHTLSSLHSADYVQCASQLFEAPCSIPPPPSTARHLISDISLSGEQMRGETFAGRKLTMLLSLRSCTLRQLRFNMRAELQVGCICDERIIFEAKHSHHSNAGARPAHIRQIRTTSAMKPFFVPSNSTPALAALSIAAYDVNGGDRRGVEWDESMHAFVLKEWEHTETERRMSPRERVQEFVRRRRHFLARSFFPEDVTPDYYSFTAWRFAQRCVSATIGVFGTSSLLFALGIRSGRIGQAAIVSWVLKEGLGRVGKMLWAGSMGKDFDVDPKRWRFRSALLYAGGNGLEIVTQIFPASFLLFATAANSMKQVSMLTSSATRNAMYRSFGERSQNIANITAKGEAQIVVADLIGMTCGIRLSRIIGSSRITVLGAYSILTMIDLFGIYMELRQVVFRSLNAERSSIMISRWLEDGVFLSPSQITRKERIFLKPQYKKSVRMSSIAKAAKDPEELNMLLRVFRREKFMVSLPRSRSEGPCRLVLRRDASNEDVLRALLLVGHLTHELKSHGKKEVISLEEGERIIRNSRSLLKRSYPFFFDGLTRKGWNTENLLFGTLKRRGYWGQ